MQILTTRSNFVGATSDDWRELIRTAIRDVTELRRVLRLPPVNDSAIRRAEAAFGTFAPQPFLNRIRLGDERDPLLLQILPVADELVTAAGFVRDPLREFAGSASEDPALPDPLSDVRGAGQRASGNGILTKYRGRALMVLTGACAVHCRFCFRRHFPYDAINKSRTAWRAALDSLARDPDCTELILSGGDPLTLVDEQLAWFLREAARLPHLRRLRIHSRLPTVIPQRVTASLCDTLAATPLPIAFVWHVNHPQEIDDSVQAAAARLKAVANVTQLNQSVLLRGVNDSAEILGALSERLFASGVLPYYLHQLDRVHGAAHFEVPQQEGIAIVQRMRESLPGYLVPRYVVEHPGHPSKTVLA